VQAVGDAFTLMSPEEKKDVAAIERFLGTSIPRVEMPDFDYKRASDPKAHAGAGGEGRGERGSRGERGGGSRQRRSSGGEATRPAAGPAAPAHGRRPARDSVNRRRKRM